MIAILGLKIPANKAHLIDQNKFQIHFHEEHAYVGNYYVSDDSHVPFCPIMYVDEDMHDIAREADKHGLWLCDDYGIHLIGG